MEVSAFDESVIQRLFDDISIRLLIKSSRRPGAEPVSFPKYVAHRNATERIPWREKPVRQEAEE